MNENILSNAIQINFIFNEKENIVKSRIPAFPTLDHHICLKSFLFSSVASTRSVIMSWSTSFQTHASHDLGIHYFPRFRAIGIIYTAQRP